MSAQPELAGGASAITRLHANFDRMRAAFFRNPYPSLVERREHLTALVAMLINNRQRIRDALRSDFYTHPDLFTDLVEISLPVERARAAINKLPEWMAPEQRHSDPAMFGDGRAYVEYQPKGIVGIIVPWNFPIEVSMGPLSDVLAAGNRAMIKPSEFTPATGALVRDMMAETFDEDHVSVAEGADDVGRAFASCKWDHLLFTGSTHVGRQVMKAAAENLVPVTLELGGKCPAIVTSSGLNSRSIFSILGAKTMKSSQVCISVDHVMVPANLRETFVEMAQVYARDTIPGFFGSADCTGLISEQHFDRIQALLDDARSKGAKLISLDESVRPDRAKRRMPLYLVLDPPADTRVMNEEIFGPVLPVLSYETLDGAISTINHGDRPLAIYVYSDDEADVERILRNTSSGGVTVNGAMIHASLSTLGFGGVGASGMGRHHGWDGFREFSNPRSIFVRGKEDIADILMPPFGDVVKNVVEAILKP